MTGITVKELLEATGGNLLHGQEDQHAKHISLDSRKMEGDDLFVPIVGERVDPAAGGNHGKRGKDHYQGNDSGGPERRIQGL